MYLGQISAADEPEAKKRLDILVDWKETNLASEKDLVIRQAVRSVWIAEVFYEGRVGLRVINLSLPLHLQTYQLGQHIAELRPDDK
ncbi:hypothetical protein LCGC14_0580820 [marine sediment metagenome]|uniref:Uncharacterized protein n=1 Tax=marine sediment metagenome TaxID=412755 RepID=A0A0F9RGH5_9ZZZZ